MASRQFFGGAITAIAPRGLIDAADIRQVPDTQDVLLFPNSNISIVVEILQRVDASQFDDAVKFHFDSLAHDNSALSSTVDSLSVIPNDRGDNTPSAIRLSGVQRIQKFNRASADEVRILMALFRVEEKSIDLVVTFNIPVEAAEGGSVKGEELSTALRQFDEFTSSFRIVDFGLFA